MKVTTINEQVSVADQITADEVQQLAQDGYQLLICNRPDGEAADQPTFDSIQAAATAAGLEAIHMPFVGNEMTEQQIVSFNKHLESGKRILAYCRSGTRSQNLWLASQQYKN